MALEALTEVAILEKKLNLNMDVTVSYRRAGLFKNYQLTERNPFTKPVEVKTEWVLQGSGKLHLPAGKSRDNTASSLIKKGLWEGRQI